MRLHKPKRRYGCEINITPLIDIVFLLIIFSMVVSQFTKMELEDIELPAAAKGQEPKEAPPSRIVVNVTREGRIVVSRRALSVASLRGLLSAESQRNGPENVSVIIRGDRNTPWRKVTEILGACAAGKIGRVKVAVTEPGAAGAAP